MPARYKQLADQLRFDLIQSSGGKRRKLPTEDALSRQYGVSRQTVRHALQLLREEGLVESVQGSGTFTVCREEQKELRQIAVITTFLDDYIFPTILHDIQATFAQEGYSVLVYATENRINREREILHQLLEQPVHGILVEGSKTALPNPNADLYQRLQRSGTAMVFLHGTCAELSNVPCVTDDNFGGGYQLARYLLDKGHRKIAGIFKSDDVQGPQRYHGVVSALRDAQIPIYDNNFRWYDTQDRIELLEQRDTSLLSRFLEVVLQGTGATALICYNDEIAYQAIRVLLSMGRRVPRDVAVVSFDNSYYSQIGPIYITSMAHRKEKMGRVAARQLVRLLRGESITSLSLDWTIMERESG